MTEHSRESADATAEFVGHRELLFSVVYNMLGTIADTEDVLQEVWLAWAARRRGGEPIDSVRAYLTRIAVNQALARRAALARRREDYVGQWLPEPLLDGEPEADGAAAVLRTESFSLAVLVVLESLGPLERAVFVLNEIFAYPHTEIAEMLDRSPAAVRQLAHRARAHVRARRPPARAVDPAVRRAVTERFVAAAMGGDLTELLAVLSPEVTLWTDGGATGPATSLRPVHGRARVAEVFAAVAAGRAHGFRVRWRTVSGDPCAVVFDGDAPLAVVVLELDADDLVAEIYSVTNPEKLTRVRATAPIRPCD